MGEKQKFEKEFQRQNILRNNVTGRRVQTKMQ